VCEVVLWNTAAKHNRRHSSESEELELHQAVHPDARVQRLAMMQQDYQREICGRAQEACDPQDCARVQVFHNARPQEVKLFLQ
jgi:hypothetical protein